MQIESEWDRRRARNRVKNRKYGRPHKLVRLELAPLVEAGLVSCARCGDPIEPGTRWHLGHDDVDPSLYQGPEHAWCNEGAPKRNVTSRRW